MSEMSYPNCLRIRWFTLLCFVLIYFEYFIREINSKHSTGPVEVLLNTANPIVVTGGIFKNKVYEFKHLHFHWGKNIHEGGEHTVESQRFPLECHLVFQQANCRSSRTESCIAVLGVHYENKQVGSKVLKPIVAEVREIKHVGMYVAKRKGYPLRQYLPKKVDSYFSYTGSLTTPPCTEGVTWIWFSDTLAITKQQDYLLHEITDDHGHKVMSNFRATQPLNGRTVYFVNPKKKHNLLN